jgi:hypothetical protein
MFNTFYINRILTAVSLVIGAVSVQAQTAATLPGATAAAVPTYTTKAAEGAAHQAVLDASKQAKQSGKLGSLPAGHTEQPLTITLTNGRSFATPTCGAVTELTVLNRSHEMGMVPQILNAANTGKPLVFEGLKCLGTGKASAVSASTKPEPMPEISQAERCKLPSLTGKLPGC